MLSRLHLQNFTVFADADFHFSPGLNVIIGTNGTGKSHVLMVGYAVLFNSISVLIKLRNTAAHTNQEGISSNFDFTELENKLTRIFQPVPSFALSKLIRHNAKSTTICYELSENIRGNVHFGESESDGSSFENLSPATAMRLGLLMSSPVLVPAKETLTLSWMTPASEQLKIPIDETYLDLLKQLRGLPLQQPEPAAAAAIKALIELLGGEVEEEGGRYYLTPGTGRNRMEMNMVAEGLRKFGTLQKLLSNGSLTPRATLFWDEPEANLNPALLRQLAEVLANLARAGFQIILATHSLFLLKQFHILSRAKDQPTLPIRYFGLNAEPGGPTEVTAVDDFELLPDVLALDEELAQADKLTILFAQDDAHTDGR